MKRKILFALLLTQALVLADSPWRKYEVYQPEITRYYVANPAFLKAKYNDHSAVIWFKGNWYCFWTGRSELSSPPLIYQSESQDARKWSMPSACFVDPELSEKPVSVSQYRPVVFISRDLLWVMWHSIDFKDAAISGTYISTLDMPGEKWQTEQLLWNEDKPLPVIDDIEYAVEFTSNPVVAESGRILVPAVLTAKDEGKAKSVCTAYSDDAGKSWELSVQRIETDPDWPGIEAAVTPEAGSSRNFAMIISAGIEPQQRKYDVIPENPSALLWSKSTDEGRTWAPAEKLKTESISSGLDIVVPYDYDKSPLKDDRSIMIFNDSAYRRHTLLRDHCGLAMFFNRGGGLDFAVGNSITGTETFATNPNIALRDERLIVSYTQGVQEAAIKTAHILNVPERGKSYIYPRTTNYKNTQRPIFTEEEFYRFEGGQHIMTEDEVRINENGFSGALWFRGDFEGVVFDSRSDEKPAGFAWLIEQNKVKLVLPGLEPFYVKNIDQEFIYWTYIGFTLDALHGRLDFYLNGKLAESREYPKDELERISSEKGHIGNSDKEEGFAGDMKFLAFYDEMLTAEQHRHIYNGFAGPLRMPYVRGGSKAPGKAVLVLDPEKSEQDGELAGFVFPPANKDGLVELETVAGRNLMRFNGQACAGLDIDTNDRRYGDYLQVEFAYMIESEDDTVLCTVGDIVDPVRIISRDNCIYMSLSGNEQLVGEVYPESWQTIVIFSGGGITRAKLGNNRFRQISHNPQATWFYLGQAFRDENQSPDTSFVIDISTVRTRVIRQ